MLENCRWWPWWLENIPRIGCNCSGKSADVVHRKNKGESYTNSTESHKHQREGTRGGKATRDDAHLARRHTCWRLYYVYIWRIYTSRVVRRRGLTPPNLDNPPFTVRDKRSLAVYYLSSGAVSGKVLVSRHCHHWRTEHTKLRPTNKGSPPSAHPTKQRWALYVSGISYVQ